MLSSALDQLVTGRPALQAPGDICAATEPLHTPARFLPRCVAAWSLFGSA